MDFFSCRLDREKGCLEYSNPRLIEEPFSEVHIYIAKLETCFLDVIVICSFL